MTSCCPHALVTSYTEGTFCDGCGALVYPPRAPAGSPYAAHWRDTGNTDALNEILDLEHGDGYEPVADEEVGR